jgi:hypothetical protein
LAGLVVAGGFAAAVLAGLAAATLLVAADAAGAVTSPISATPAITMPGSRTRIQRLARRPRAGLCPLPLMARFMIDIAPPLRAPYLPFYQTITDIFRQG